jgi:SAM-dependent methyltransferase
VLPNVQEPAQPVSYGTFHQAWDGFADYLQSLLETARPRYVGEIGAGARPLFGLDLAARLGFRYALLDISAEQLAQAPAGYDKQVCDIGARVLSVGPERYDLMFSRMLCEHVADGEQLHRNVLALLRPGGIAVHFMPTLFALPFVINRLLPERLGQRLLSAVSPLARGRRKFPAYYSWCRGPTAASLADFRRLGYEVVQYKGFFGHGYYQPLRPLFSLHWKLSELLVQHPQPALTSYAWVTLRRPG